jgi:multidrug resistance efflux pump
VQGAVTQIFIREGEIVSQGGRLASLSNVPMQSGLEDAKARLVLASARAKEAALSYQGYGNALMDKERSTKQYGQLQEMSATLELTAPITGTVVTPKIQDQLGEYLKSGGQLLEIADLTQMRARIYISEYDLYKIRTGETARLQFDGVLRRRDGQVSLVSARPTEVSLAEAEQAKATSTPGRSHQFYFVDIVVGNPEQALKPGMTGVARVYSSRRSFGGMALEEVKNFWGRKLW